MKLDLKNLNEFDSLGSSVRLVDENQVAAKFKKLPQCKHNG